jgi:hypothetical protein
MTPITPVFESTTIGKNRFTLLITLIFVQLLILYAFIQGEIVVVFALVLGLAFLLFGAFSVERSFYLAAFYCLSFPEKYFLHNFPGIPVYFIWTIGYPLFLILLGYWFLYLIRNQTFGRPESSESFSFSTMIASRIKVMDVLLLTFIVAFSLSGILGYLKGNNRTYWAYDLMSLSLYLSYFIYYYSPLRKNPKLFYDFVLFCSILVSTQFIYSLIQLGGTVFLRRVISEHIHITLMAISYLGATIIYSSSKLRRIIFPLLLIIVLVGVLISQQRALWASVGVTLIILLLIFTYEKRRLLFASVTKVLVGMGLAIIVMGGLFILLQILTKGKLLPTIISRILIFVSPNLLRFDISAIERITAIKNALSEVGDNFLFGQGLGASIVSRWRLAEQLTVDNSLVFLYWKTGILGLFSFIILILYFFYRCFSTLRKKLITEEKIYVLSALINMLGLIIVAFTNVCIVHYRFIIVWAATFAVVELIARKYEQPQQ